MTETPAPAPTKTFLRLARYFLAKSIPLLASLAAGLYLTILVINLGGAVDDIFRSDITQALSDRLRGGWLRDTPLEERNRILAETQQQMEEAMGLHEPFLLRSLRWLGNALRLDLGETSTSYFLTTGLDGPVEALVLDHLPYTLGILGIANLLLFFFSVFAALVLSRRPGGLLDRLVLLLSPLTSAPGWIYGVLLILVFAGQLHWLPYPRSLDIRDFTWSAANVSLLLRLSALPVLSIFLSAFFQGIYAWRTLFLIYAGEDHVELGYAKGLPARAVERRYILRPALPYVVTSFTMLMIGLWQSSIALEYLFLWPGVGTLFLSAIGRFNTPLALGVVTVFAYMLAAAVLALDVIYAFVDPRIRIESGAPSVRLKIRKRGGARRAPPRRRSALPREGRARRGARPEGRRGLQGPWAVLGELIRLPAGAAGLVIVLLMSAVAIGVVVALPASQAASLWMSQDGGDRPSPWYDHPAAALPAWINLFRREKLPATVVLDSRAGDCAREVRPAGEGMTEIELLFRFEHDTRAFPQDMILYIESRFDAKRPLLTLTWITPDGREIPMGNLIPDSTFVTHYLSANERLQRRLGGEVIEGLFADPGSPSPAALPGLYRLRLTGLVFEAGSDLDAELVVYGGVHGLAGTDHQRRDLALPLLWGIPVALAFGLLGALATSLAAMGLAAAGAWFGGPVDSLIQRLCEVNLILPALPIAILVFTMYSKSIWAILGVIVLLNIFGNALKNYRAVFLQVKEMPYVEAARAYGAGNWRIIWRYLTPRLLPVMIPQLVTTVPGYVFYETTLAYLRVSDPSLPTWGKIIYDALANHALQSHPLWLLEPIALLLLLAGGFALLGMSLERVLNPRLRAE